VSFGTTITFRPSVEVNTASLEEENRRLRGELKRLKGGQGLNKRYSRNSFRAANALIETAIALRPVAYRSAFSWFSQSSYFKLPTAILGSRLGWVLREGGIRDLPMPLKCGNHTP
jgi:hypothetical protein